MVSGKKRGIGSSCIRHRWCLRFVILVATLFVAVSNVSAQYSLLESLKAAKQHGREIEKQQSYIRAAEADIVTATAALLPDVLLEVGVGAYSRKQAYSSSQSTHREESGYANVSLRASQVVLDSGDRLFAIEAARLKRTIEESRLDMIEQQTLMNAAKAHYNVIYRRAITTELQSHLKFLRAETRVETGRFDNGAATLREYSLVGSYVASVETAYLDAKNLLQNSVSVYEQQSGHSPLLNLLTHENKISLPETLSEALEIAKAEHPILSANQLLEEHLRANIKSSEAKLGAKLYLEGSLSRGRVPEHRYEELASIGLRLVVPIMSKSIAQKAVLPDKEELLRHQLDAVKMFENIVTDVEVVFSAVANNKKKLIASQRAAKKARLAFHASRLGREENLHTTPEMLEVHAIMVDAILQELLAERELQIAEIALLYSIGRLKLDTLQFSSAHIPIPTPRVIVYSEKDSEPNSLNVVQAGDVWEGLRDVFAGSPKLGKALNRGFENDR